MRELPKAKGGEAIFDRMRDQGTKRNSPMEWIFEFFKKLKQVLTDEVIQRIDTRKGVSQGMSSGVSLRLKRARGSGELYVVMRSVIEGMHNDHHFTKHEFIQFSNAVETILNSLKPPTG
jgi:hypothetical protein